MRRVQTQRVPGNRSAFRCAALALLAGCSSLLYASDMTGADRRDDSFAAREWVVLARVTSGRVEVMEVELIVPARVAPGEPVPVTLRVRNKGTDPVVLGLTGRPVAFDLVVARPDGSEVWRRLHGATVPLVLQLRRLEPGEVLEFSDRWLQVDNSGRAVGPGRYTVRGSIPAEDRELVSEARDLVISS